MISYKMYVEHMSGVMRKPDLCLCENKAADQLAVAVQLMKAFVFATWKVHFLLNLYPNFQDCSFLTVQTGLCRIWTEPLKISSDEAHMMQLIIVMVFSHYQNFGDIPCYSTNYFNTDAL